VSLALGIDGGIMTRFFIPLVILLAFLLCQQAQAEWVETNADPELQRMTVALDQATSQADMNLASFQIGVYWEAKLAELEKRISKTLDAKQQKQFARSMGLWRLYRTQEIQFQSGFYEGGSIQPFIANETYAGITEDRVNDLDSLWTQMASEGATNGATSTNDDQDVDDTVVQVTLLDFHSKRLLSELEFYVARYSTFETNHFYVGATELNGTNLVKALVYWNEPRILMEYREPNNNAQKGAESFPWRGFHLKLGRDTADIPEDMNGSTYTSDQWVEWMEECVYNGKPFVVTLNKATNAFPNADRTKADDD
jgi:Lysozyme inhibitor LprI